eukprot:TRINITY_DN2642_c0_g1_i4.p1 TRINITY_DN2642_c0_g1~~TRINITY_DN2642_c0_g1_i4.p1  ORF type:complete len:125 (-),score=17.46 TRINITY_DN2642_c0_g1_i4:15-389(-)
MSREHLQYTPRPTFKLLCPSQLHAVHSQQSILRVQCHQLICSLHPLDRPQELPTQRPPLLMPQLGGCLLYTSDAADEEDSVDLGGRRIIKKKKNRVQRITRTEISKTDTKQIQANVSRVTYKLS